MLKHVARCTLFLLWLLLAPTAPAQSQSDRGDFQPYIGQEGKDVVWVPTPPALVDRMLQLAKTTAEDFVVDLGSGDGRIAIAAAKKFGARSLGIEFNPDMVAISRRDAEREGVSERAKFTRADIFAADFSQATVVTMYLLPDLNLKLRPVILAMKPGTRVVSHHFNMGDWEPDETVWEENRRAMLWIVPAQVAGRWRLSLGDAGGEYDLAFRQEFQKLEGEIQRGTRARLFGAKLSGDSIGFTFIEGTRVRVFAGRVAGNEITGIMRITGQPDVAWRAVRK